MRWASRNPFVWHRWFAWHPVEIGDQWVWLETVERKCAGMAHDYRLVEK